MVLSDMEAGRFACVRIGGPLLFGRLWERLGLGCVVNELVDGRGFEFALERAVFVSVLHRLFVSGSDRSCEKWMVDYAIPGAADLRLHHLYRAIAWLGEELAPAAEGELAPRCVKDEIEERLFARRRDLFTDLSLVFMDTTSLSFHGAGGESLGAHGHSKDHRPDLRQMVLAVVLDGEGRPVCTEMLAGNVADMTVLLPAVDRLRKRFGIGRVCVVADRGMISAATIAALEERGLDYILGARERGTAVIREIVLRDEKPFVPLLIERGRGDTQLFIKEVKADDARYIVCRNEAEAEKHRADRQAVVAGLQKRLAGGEKALIGNSAYRRYLRRTGAGKAFEIDAGKLAEEARFDGIFVLRTNATMTPLNAVLRYALRSDKEAGGEPHAYTEGRDGEVDAAIAACGLRLPERPLRWEAVDLLFEAGAHQAAARAQRYAVPVLADLLASVREPSVQGLVGDAAYGTGSESVTQAFIRILTALSGDWPVMFAPTAFDIGGARLAAVDLAEVAPQGSAEADRQSAAFYLLARHALTRHWWIGEDSLAAIPEPYRDWHAARLRDIRESPKRLCYDEFHRTAGAPAVRAQVERDVREARKLRVRLALASQRLEDFGGALAELANRYWILGSGGKAKEAETLSATFGLGGTLNEAVRYRLTGPGRDGAPALLIAAGQGGRFEQLVVNTPGPVELWALTTSPADVALRRRVHALLPPALARASLARAFPEGSARSRIECELARSALRVIDSPDAGGAASEEAVLDRLADEVARAAANRTSEPPPPAQDGPA